MDSGRATVTRRLRRDAAGNTRSFTYRDDTWRFAADTDVMKTPRSKIRQFMCEKRSKQFKKTSLLFLLKRDNKLAWLCWLEKKSYSFGLFTSQDHSRHFKRILSVTLRWSSCKLNNESDQKQIFSLGLWTIHLQILGLKIPNSPGLNWATFWRFLQRDFLNI